MILPENHQIFQTSNELQEFLLTQRPETLVIVPQMRLAHQVWRRQRLAARDAGRAAWEPVAMTTLSGWFQQLWRQLWLPVRPATSWERLVLWLQAMAAVPPEEGVTADLSWAVLLDEAYDLCQRYRLPAPIGLEAESPLIIWRQAVSQLFADLLTDRGLITSAAMPDFLLEALSQGNLAFPDRLVLVGMETPAPVEQEWLQAVAQYLPVTQVHLTGRQEEEVTLQGLALPDRRQEIEWVSAQVLELAHNQGVPLHRLAITAPNLETYLPDLRRIWQELLGSAVIPTGGSYNFSLGSTLAETPLFHAALLPLQFILSGEQRQDLIGWLRSPFYGAFGRYDKTFLRWDLAWREYGRRYGWIGLRDLIISANTPLPDPLPSRGEGNDERAAKGEEKEDGAGNEALLHLIDQALSLLPQDQAPADVWRRRLLEIWQLLEFPHHLNPEEAGQWQACLNLLNEFALAGGERPWTAALLVEWLSWGAARHDLPGEGSVDTGIQIQGLLELRGLDFDAVFCLGLNMGVFPPPPRQLPLLTSREKTLILGGDYQSQRKFAETSYRYLVAAAPQLILTRPLVDQEAEQIASYIIPPTIWKKDPAKFAVLSHPHPAWLRSPAIRAAFLIRVSGFTTDPPERINIALPEQISLSALEAALTCPCRFFLNNLLGLGELPDLEPGLTPLERGEVIHAVLHEFTNRFMPVLQNDGDWDDQKASQLLEEVASKCLPPGLIDSHWEAELNRWLMDKEGLLQQWLQQEKQRYLEGWRWLAMEASFVGMELAGWPTKIKGRLDRLDSHESWGLMIWDYKTGVLPGKNIVTVERHGFQLAGYLLAVQQGLVTVPPHPKARAGIIGLKSSRAEHLKFEDYNLTAEGWQEILKIKLPNVAKIGARVGEGNFSPDPSQPPPAKNNSCQFCPLSLLCGHSPDWAGEEDE